MKLTGAALVFTMLVALAACTNGGGLGSIGGGGGGSPSPLPSGAIGVGIPTGKIGVEVDPTWGTVSGYTQNQTSQVLAFAPGTKVVVKNLSSTTPHTLNVVAVASSPPPKWPKNPNLKFSASGNGVLSAKYASGSLNPGASVTVTLSKPGTYLIGCAYHYPGFNMRDVIQVVAGATPGPTASPGPGGYAAIVGKRNAAPARMPQLVDQQGHRFAIGSLRGNPFAVTFVSAHCSDACPLINAQFSEAARRMQRENLSGRLLTITLDPEHDSPATMHQLAKRFDANPRYWLLAGGPVRNVRAIMRTFGVVSMEGRRGYADRHTTFVYVFNAEGVLMKTVLASTALSDTVVDALRYPRLVAQR